MKKTFLIVAPVFTMLALIIFVLNAFNVNPSPFFVPIGTLLWMITLFWSFTLIYARGTLKISKWKRLLFLSIGFYIIGMLFKINHWEGSGMLLLGSSAIFILSYGLHFFTKQKIRLFDIIKVMYVSIGVLAAFFRIEHFPYNDALSWASFILAFVMISFFYYEYYNEKPEKKSNIADQGHDIFIYEDTIPQ